jgi:hypothetical protein
MLLNSGSSSVFLVDWAKAMEAADSSSSDNTIKARIKLSFLMDKGLNHRNLSTFIHKIS